MKKKLITVLMGLMLSAGLIGGCGQTNNSSESVKQEETAEGKELTGTIDEIKDFMFVVTDKNGLHMALLLKKSRKVWRMSATVIP